MRLPLDYALCDGNGEPICADCVRRTAERPPLHWQMEPQATDDDCALYMEPHGYRLREPQDDGA